MVNSAEVGTFNFTGAHILNCCLGVVMYTYYAFTKNWLMSNIFGLAVAFNSLEVLLQLVLDKTDWKYIQLDTFMAGFVLLGGLFFYDIFFVFGTDVMVTVAISMDVPIKVPLVSLTLSPLNSPLTVFRSWSPRNTSSSRKLKNLNSRCSG